MNSKVVALSGGIGGAKLALGLSHVVAPENLLIVANTGDDFEHLGLSISPDLDTLTYVLAGLDDRERGWGRAGESWAFMEALGSLGGETWFALGDRDLALHVERTRRLKAGETLSAITATLAARLGVKPAIVPMSDDPVRTRLKTAQGWLDFQDYFVRLHCEPAVEEIAFAGAETARPHPRLIEALQAPDLGAVVICPSNPLISIEPILAVPGIRAALAAVEAPIVAVSPIVGGAALKGPTAKMFAELGVTPSAEAVFRRYADLIDILVVDETEAPLPADLLPRTRAAQTIMRTLDDRIALARAVLAAADGA
jgi:LPPG:FO 2-phospho-L-lactate transferase